MSVNPEQPALPIFTEDYVWYEIKQPSMRAVDQDTGTLPRTVKVAVDELHTIEDPNLRDALWRQHVGNMTDKEFGTLVFAERDGTYSHSIGIPRAPLLLPEGDFGLLPPDQEATVAMTQRSNAVSRLFARLFGP